MMWTDKAFAIFMGDVMAREPAAARDREVELANAMRDQAIEDAAACEDAINARRAGSFAGSPAMAGRTQAVRGAHG